MRKLLLGTAISFAMAGGASAADMYVKGPLYNWTGFYVGGNIGYSWGRSDTTVDFFNSGTGALLASASDSFSMNGIIGGGQAGYNWQTGRWVWGLEADIQGSGQQGSSVFACGPACGVPAVTETFDQRLDWFGTVRVRAGYTVTPTVLVYATGGLAYGDVETNSFLSTLATFSGRVVKAGWTAGGGIEAALGGRWTGRVEYLYMNLGSVEDAIARPKPIIVSSSSLSGITDNILRVSVNYRF
jgi:outer membrane immunogenic protein